MPDITYTRRYAATDGVEVINGNGSWNIERSSEPLTLWLRVPDTSEGVQKLMEYNWDEDTWTDVTP